MIIHKLIAHHWRARDDATFYRLQAEDAVAWLEANGAISRPRLRAIDLGCGHGLFGARLLESGCEVTFADTVNYLEPSLKNAPFLPIDLDHDDITRLGSYDLVICSNVFEHLSRPAQFIESLAKIVNPGGLAYLSWTNWLSPWGGHEFSPFHYLGARRGHLVYDKLVRRKRYHTPYQNLFPTYIGETIARINAQPGLEVLKVVPRYYPEFAFLLKIPLLREFLAWNCAVLARKLESGPGGRGRG
jgi:2-polyprenyl-3-methyl-5-hydroxy-6-metoxy-1,4-benzoquinol methylase